MIIKSQSQIKDNENGLYLVSTPIGNLKDITLRAIEILKKSTYILCEDTRVSRILLNRYEIKSRLISNHKFNESKNLNKIIDLLKSGETISLISDAGTPSISDPGAILVNECIKHNIKIIPIPGPSAVATALSISGFSEKFIFHGFLPEKKQALANVLDKISKFDETCVFFISSNDFKISNGWFTTIYYCHFLSVFRVSPNWCIDSTSIMRNDTFNESCIFSSHSF